MADTKISGLTAASVAAVANELPVNEAGTSKKVTITQLVTLLQTLGMPRVKRLGTQHDNSTTTGTEVTDLTMALEAGTYTFKHSLIMQVNSGAVAPRLGVNFTGTAATKTMIASWADATLALTDQTYKMDDQGDLTWGFISGMANKAYTTTAPNMGPKAGGPSAVDLPMVIEGILIVTASGNLALWNAASSGSVTSSVMVGSSLVVVRTA